VKVLASLPIGFVVFMVQLATILVRGAGINLTRSGSIREVRGSGIIMLLIQLNHGLY